MKDEHHYEAVARELAGDSRKPGLWLRALTEADGDEKRAQAGYVKARVAELKSAETAGKKLVRANDLTRLQGVKGWLLVTCLWLTIFGPLVTVLGLVGSWGQLGAQLGSDIEYVKGCLILDTLIVCGLAYAGIVCGSALWKRQSGAVESSILFLRVKFGYSFVRAILWGMVGARLHTVLAPGQIYLSAFLLVVAEAIKLWVELAYFKRSKRVHVNFPSYSHGQYSEEVGYWGWVHGVAAVVILLIGGFTGEPVPGRVAALPARTEAAQPRVVLSPTAAPTVTVRSESSPMPPREQARQLFAEGVQANDAHQTRLAINKYSEAIALDPNYALAYTNQGRAHRELKQYGSALYSFTKSIGLDPTNPVAYLERGFLHNILNQSASAIEDFSKAIELDPENTYAYSNRGLAYNDLKQFDRALLDHNKAIELEPKNADAHFGRGLAYGNLNQSSRAIEDFNRAIELKPKEAATYYNRGLAFSNLKQFERAIDDYSKAIELDPNNDDAYNNRGSTYIDLKQPERGVEDLNKAIELNPKSVPAYSNRGYAYTMFNRHDLAVADYSKAIALDPMNANAYSLRGRSYSLLGRQKEAKQDYAVATKLTGKNR